MTITEGGTITPETAEEKYTYGNLAYAAAASPAWPISIRLAIRAERDALLDALEAYEAIERGQISPGDEYEDLTGHPDAKREALARAADAAAERTAELVRVFPPAAVPAEVAA